MEAPAKPKLLIVDDEELIRTQMKWALADGYEVFLAADRPSAIEIVRREKPPVVTLDLGLPPQPRDVEEGFRALAAILEEDRLTKVIVVTGRGEKEHALRAIGHGAYDFFCKPIEVDELKVLLRRATEVHRLESENRDLERRIAVEPVEQMIGSSPQMQDVFAAIRKVATTDVPVLIIGESGTGKELVARAVHARSRAAAGPFVPINCAAIPENLLESELFGHEKGAFTGAHAQRKGRIEMASGGTLFLDEIGELSQPLQAKLLRYLQDQRIERVGGREAIIVEARVIAATNADLKKAMREGRFREDLYYRLGVVTISVPPLRERGDDVLVIAKTLLERHKTAAGKKLGGFDQPAIAALRAHAWPGNVRELENRIKRAVIMADGKRISAADLELDSSFEKYAGKGLREAREALDRELVERALARTNGNVTRAAEELGVSRPTLHELIAKHRLRVEP